jgi:hypothetical protein
LALSGVAIRPAEFPSQARKRHFNLTSGTIALALVDQLLQIHCGVVVASVAQTSVAQRLAVDVRAVGRLSVKGT